MFAFLLLLLLLLLLFLLLLFLLLLLLLLLLLFYSPLLFVALPAQSLIYLYFVQTDPTNDEVVRNEKFISGESETIVLFGFRLNLHHFTLFDVATTLNLNCCSFACSEIRFFFLACCLSGLVSIFAGRKALVDIQVMFACYFLCVSPYIHLVAYVQLLVFPLFSFFLASLPSG